MDPIADMLTRIRNAGAVQKEYTDIPHSDIKFKIAEILQKKGFISEVKKIKRKERKFIRLFLKYNKDIPVISGIKRASRPGQRIYKGYKEIRKIKGGYGFSIISTSNGLMTGDEARSKKVGGELIAIIW